MTITRFLTSSSLVGLLSCANVQAASYEEIAENLFKSGHREDAVRTISEAIKVAPKSGYLYSIRGRYQLRGENYKEALADFTRAIAIDPTQKQNWLYRMRADCYINLGNYQAGIADLKQAIALKPMDEYYKILGEVYYQQKRFDEAIDSFTRGIAINKKNYWLFKCRGDIYFLQHKYQKAVDDYTSVIRLMPNESVGYGSRAKAYEKMGLHSLADKDFARTRKDNDFMGDLLK